MARRCVIQGEAAQFRGVAGIPADAGGFGLDVDVTRDELAQSILNRRFRTTMSIGYDEREVDDALDALVALVRAGGDADAADTMVSGLSLRMVRLRKGYDPQEVDELLDSIAASLRGDVSPTTSEGAGIPVQPSPAEPPLAPSTMLPSAVVENPRQGLFGRLFGR